MVVSAVSSHRQEFRPASHQQYFFFIDHPEQLSTVRDASDWNSFFQIRFFRLAHTSTSPRADHFTCA